MPDKESYNESIDNPKDKLKEDKERLINSIADVFEANKDNDGIKNIDDLFNKFRPIFRNYGYSLIINDIHTRYRNNIKAEYDKNPFTMPINSQQGTDTRILNRLRSLNKDVFKKWLTDLFKENWGKKTISSINKFKRSYEENLYISYNSKVAKSYCEDYSIIYSLERRVERGKGPLSDKEIQNLINEEKRKKSNEAKAQPSSVDTKQEVEKYKEDIDKLRFNVLKIIDGLTYNDKDEKKNVEAFKEDLLKLQLFQNIDGGSERFLNHLKRIKTVNEGKKTMRSYIEGDRFNVRCAKYIKRRKIRAFRDLSEKVSNFSQNSKDITTSQNNNTEEIDEENNFNKAFKEIDEISKDGYSNYGELKDKIFDIFNNNGIDLNSSDTKSEIHTTYGFDLDLYGENTPEPAIMTYALACGIGDINTENDLKEFVRTVQSINRGENVSGKYVERYKKFLKKMGEYYEECLEQVAIKSLIARYEAANAVADGRSFYESMALNLFNSSDDEQNQSGAEIASNISDIDNKLNHYSCKSNRTEHEEAALRYTAFDITFKNTFNLTNPIIEKLAAQQVNLRDDLLSYHIYNSDNNSFNKSARDKYVTEKLQAIGLAAQEIEELGNAMAGLPAEVEKNYKTLCDNFDADQNSFEKIAKIYALGEIIDNIKKLFSNREKLKDLEDSMQSKFDDKGFEFDENPADVVGDCLLLRGKINGTEANIKYDLRTGKLYMNSFTQEYFNPPKIIIGNKEPNTEIGNIENFDSLLEGYQSTPFTQNDNIDYSETSSDNVASDENNNDNNQDSDESKNESPEQKALESLMKNKLAEIGEIVKEKAGEQGNENNVIDSFLKTFNILPDDSNLNSSMDVEFIGGSELFTVLKRIKDTNSEQELRGFSIAMNQLMERCGFKWGENNLQSRENEFESITIFDIDEKNASTDIINLQRACQNFFSDDNGEKDKIKGCERHFDASVQLSFANIIVEKCCGRIGDNYGVSANKTASFVNNIIEIIEDIKKDENDLATVEAIMDNDSMWT